MIAGSLKLHPTFFLKIHAGGLTLVDDSTPRGLALRATAGLLTTPALLPASVGSHRRLVKAYTVCNGLWFDGEGTDTGHNKGLGGGTFKPNESSRCGSN